MASATDSPLTAPACITMVGLGAMGIPMAARLKAAGFVVRGADPSAAACAAFAREIGAAFASAAEAVADGTVQAVITMLPNSKIVREVLLGPGGIAGLLKPGTLVIDMSSSVPTDTITLDRDLAAQNLELMDAPVSGGVKRAIDGSLSIMAGGPASRVERARPLLAAMGKSIFPTGPIGSGHAMKALNNYVSAAGLIAACEALMVGKSFGLAPETIVDVLNASTGRNNSTEVKMKPFIIPENYTSGFALALMAKDLAIAADLANHLKLDIPQIQTVSQIWADARDTLDDGADHTAIYAYLAKIGQGDA